MPSAVIAGAIWADDFQQRKHRISRLTRLHAKAGLVLLRQEVRRREAASPEPISTALGGYGFRARVLRTRRGMTPTKIF